MSGEHNWRLDDEDAQIYFGHQRKQLTVADRRPLIRQGSDLVGPGIGPAAIMLTDFNDVLALFNGYFRAPAGATGAPNASEAFVGIVVIDDNIGGYQQFRGMTSEITYTRYVRRGVLDPEFVDYGPWKATSGAQAGRVNVTMSAAASGSAPVLFPAPFSAAPIINVSSPSTNWLPFYTNVTTQGFDAVLQHRTGSGSSTISVNWQAMLPT